MPLCPALKVACYAAGILLQNLLLLVQVLFLYNPLFEWSTSAQLCKCLCLLLNGPLVSVPARQAKLPEVHHDGLVCLPPAPPALCSAPPSSVPCLAFA